jgi:hypothetical protein
MSSRFVAFSASCRRRLTNIRCHRSAIRAEKGFDGPAHEVGLRLLCLARARLLAAATQIGTETVAATEIGIATGRVTSSATKGQHLSHDSTPFAYFPVDLAETMFVLPGLEVAAGERPSAAMHAIVLTSHSPPQERRTTKKVFCLPQPSLQTLFRNLCPGTTMIGSARESVAQWSLTTAARLHAAKSSGDRTKRTRKQKQVSSSTMRVAFSSLFYQ